MENTVGTNIEHVAYCQSCGYDLRASGEARRCPECGRGFEPGDPATYAPRPPRRGLRRWSMRGAVLLAVLALLLGSTWGWLYWGWKSEQNAVARMGARVYVVAPLGGKQWQRNLGPAGWVLERTRRVSFPSTTTDADLVHLKKLPGLEHLVLAHTKVTDVGLVHLRELRGLRVLWLVHTPVTDEGLVHLRELKGLQNLWLNGTPVTKAGVKELQAALPGCLIFGP